MNRYASESILKQLTGADPREGDLLIREGQAWSFSNTLGPVYHHGDVSDELSIDFFQAAMHSAIISGNVNINRPTNIRLGRTYMLILKQDAIGNHSVTWDNIFKWPNGAPPDLSTESNMIDVISFAAVSVGEDIMLCGAALTGFA